MDSACRLLFPRSVSVRANYVWLSCRSLHSSTNHTSEQFSIRDRRGKGGHNKPVYTLHLDTTHSTLTRNQNLLHTPNTQPRICSTAQSSQLLRQNPRPRLSHREHPIQLHTVLTNRYTKTRTNYTQACSSHSPAVLWV